MHWCTMQLIFFRFVDYFSIVFHSMVLAMFIPLLIRFIVIHILYILLLYLLPTFIELIQFHKILHSVYCLYLHLLIL
eukprot:UN17124